jgi:hypothetical protein
MKDGTSKTAKKPGRPSTKITEAVVDFAAAEDIIIDPKKEVDQSDVDKAMPPEVPNFGLGVVKTYEQYYHTLDAARTREIEFIEVSEPFFKLITKGVKTPYFIHGDPAVYVYIEGTRDKILIDDAMTADEKAGLPSKAKK